GFRSSKASQPALPGSRLLHIESQKRRGLRPAARDLREAIRLVRAHEKTFSIDPHRIAVIEESSSGQIICGTRDGLFARHKAFANELDKAGSDFDAVALEGAPHGMENWEGRPE